LAFLAGAGVLAFAMIGTPASAVVGQDYVWPLTIFQPVAVNFYAGNHFLSMSCTVTQNPKYHEGVIATGSTTNRPYMVSTTPGGSAGLLVTVGSTLERTQILNGATVNCVVTVLDSKTAQNPTNATGQSTLTLKVDTVFSSPGERLGVTLPHPSPPAGAVTSLKSINFVTMPNITINR
jgi:hypothetical protein